MQQAIANSPNDAELHDALGALYGQQHQWLLARDEFAKAIGLEPENRRLIFIWAPRCSVRAKWMRQSES